MNELDGPETNPASGSETTPASGSETTPALSPETSEADHTAEAAERALRAGRATKGGLAAILCLEAFVVLLVPRAIAQTSGLTATKTFLLLALAIVLVACGFMLRRPWGIGLGSALQVPMAATVILIPVMFIVVLFFLFLWWFLLRTRQQLVGTPSGWRMLVS